MRKGTVTYGGWVGPFWSLKPVSTRYYLGGAFRVNLTFGTNWSWFWTKKSKLVYLIVENFQIFTHTSDVLFIQYLNIYSTHQDDPVDDNKV